MRINDNYFVCKLCNKEVRAKSRQQHLIRIHMIKTGDYRTNFEIAVYFGRLRKQAEVKLKNRENERTENWRRFGDRDFEQEIKTEPTFG